MRSLLSSASSLLPFHRLSEKKRCARPDQLRTRSLAFEALEPLIMMDGAEATPAAVEGFPNESGLLTDGRTLATLRLEMDAMQEEARRVTASRDETSALLVQSDRRLQELERNQEDIAAALASLRDSRAAKASDLAALEAEYDPLRHEEESLRARLDAAGESLSRARGVMHEEELRTGGALLSLEKSISNVEDFLSSYDLPDSVVPPLSEEVHPAVQRAVGEIHDLFSLIHARPSGPVARQAGLHAWNLLGHAVRFLQSDAAHVRAVDSLAGAIKEHEDALAAVARIDALRASIANLAAELASLDLSLADHGEELRNIERASAEEATRSVTLETQFRMLTLEHSALTGRITRLEEEMRAHPENVDHVLNERIVSFLEHGAPALPQLPDGDGPDALLAAREASTLLRSYIDELSMLLREAEDALEASPSSPLEESVMSLHRAFDDVTQSIRTVSDALLRLSATSLSEESMPLLDDATGVLRTSPLHIESVPSAYDAEHDRAELVLSLDEGLGAVRLASYKGPMRSPPSLSVVTGEDGNIVSAYGSAFTLDFSETHGAVNAVSLTFRTENDAPVTAVAYRGETELSTVTAPSGQPLILDDPAGITSVIVFLDTPAMTPLAREYLEYSESLEGRWEKANSSISQYDWLYKTFGHEGKAVRAFFVGRNITDRDVITATVEEALAGIRGSKITLTDATVRAAATESFIPPAPLAQSQNRRLSIHTAPDWFPSKNPMQDIINRQWPSATQAHWGTLGNYGARILVTASPDRFTRFDLMTVAGSSGFISGVSFITGSGYVPLPASHYTLLSGGKTVIFHPGVHQSGLVIHLSHRGVLPNETYSLRQDARSDFSMIAPPEGLAIEPRMQTLDPNDPIAAPGNDYIPGKAYIGPGRNVRVYMHVFNKGLGEGRNLTARGYINYDGGTSSGFIGEKSIAVLGGQSVAGAYFEGVIPSTDTRYNPFFTLKILDAEGNVVSVTSHVLARDDLRSSEQFPGEHSAAERERLARINRQIIDTIHIAGDPRITAWYPNGVSEALANANAHLAQAGNDAVDVSEEAEEDALELLSELQEDVLTDAMALAMALELAQQNGVNTSGVSYVPPSLDAARTFHVVTTAYAGTDATVERANLLVTNETVMGRIFLGATSRRMHTLGQSERLFFFRQVEAVTGMDAMILMNASQILDYDTFVRRAKGLFEQHGFGHIFLSSPDALDHSVAVRTWTDQSFYNGGTIRVGFDVIPNGHTVSHASVYLIDAGTGDQLLSQPLSGTIKGKMYTDIPVSSLAVLGGRMPVTIKTVVWFNEQRDGNHVKVFNYGREKFGFTLDEEDDGSQPELHAYDNPFGVIPDVGDYSDKELFGIDWSQEHAARFSCVVAARAIVNHFQEFYGDASLPFLGNETATNFNGAARYMTDIMHNDVLNKEIDVPGFTKFYAKQDAHEAPPIGALVVWEPTGANPHGHIAVVVGIDQQSGNFLVFEGNYISGSARIRNVASQQGIIGWMIPHSILNNV